MEYGCIGEHLGHSFSKEIHNALADYKYELCELEPTALSAFFEDRKFNAINVTIPYKRDVIKYLDWISDEAKAINAVNTIVNKSGKLYGYNTDFYGLKSLIERHNVSLKGKKVAILGSGGTSNTAFAVAQSMGAEMILKVSRIQREGYITYDDLRNTFSDFEIIINTTPCGMFPATGVSPIEISDFHNLVAVFDAVYNPLKSKLVCDSCEKEIIASGGLYMLVSQAAYAVEKFIDKPVDVERVECIFRELYKEKMNIILIGMPSSGKTSVGKVLAELLNKKFVDTDALIADFHGKSIPDIFKSDGEAFFRELETKIINNVSKENACIVATGGGAILNKVNIDMLKGNGRVYFIDRSLDKLITTDDRPLSNNRIDLEKRYRERYSKYIASADVVIDGNGTVEEVAKRIEADFIEYSCN